MKQDKPILVTQVPCEEAISQLQSLEASCGMLQTRVSPLTNVVRLGTSTRLAGYNSSGFLSSTGELCKFGPRVRSHRSGGVLVALDRDCDIDETDKGRVESAIIELHDWCHNQGVWSVATLNTLKEVGRGRKDFILAAECRQEAQLCSIVRQIQMRTSPEGNQAKSMVRLICIAGPTSSCKTTFATKLCGYLKNAGLPASVLTVDHYYLPLDQQPRYATRQLRSDVDYDHIESMDVALVNEHLNALICGKEVMKPNYNMKTGYRESQGEKFSVCNGGILLIEGIHALNPSYTQTVPPDQVFKIFLSPVTALQLDDGNVIKSTDSRLLRRLARDYLFRGNSASTTLGMWENVRRGEGTWIFPFQGNADFVANTAHEYEIAVLKTIVEPLLKAVPISDAGYLKAQELLQLLDTVNGWFERDVPTTSLLREFIGNGAYDLH